MNKNVIEILNILIKKLLNEDDIESNKRNITIKLENRGYSIQDINKAFKFLLQDDDNFENIDEREFYIDRNIQSGSDYNRVFTKTENMVFDKQIKNLIYKIKNLEVLKTYELELIIEHMLHMAVYGDLEVDLVWEIITDVVKNNEAVLLISEEISEFNDNEFKDRRVN